MRIRGARLLSAAILAAAASLGAVASEEPAERILDYHSDIVLADDGSLAVTETIRVNSAGTNIRHGIYRDFPTVYTDHLQNEYVVGFALMSAARDGQPETSRVEERDNGKHIYLGSESVSLEPGEHTYVIAYSTNRQMGFFKDHDELYWNVTGNGWLFFLDHVSATVHLPSRIPAADVRLTGYTGEAGSTDQNLTWSASGDGAFQFESRAPLAPGEGMTIVAGWPKGYIAPPTTEQKLGYFIRDNWANFVAWCSLAVLLVFYLAVFVVVSSAGKPEHVVVVYEPPPDVSPARMRYLVREKYDSRTFSAAILNIAVKGVLKIRQAHGHYLLTRPTKDHSALSVDESRVVETLFDSHNEVRTDDRSSSALRVASSALSSLLEKRRKEPANAATGPYQPLAFLFTAATLVVTAWGFEPRHRGVALAMLFLFGMACFAVGKAVERLASSSSSVAPSRWDKMWKTATFPLMAGGFFALIALMQEVSGTYLLAIALQFVLHAIFRRALRPRDPALQAMLVQIDGFKMFLTAVEGDQLRRMVTPEQAPQMFEKFFPYAVALGVEKVWAEKFSGILAAAGGAATADYSPSWFVGKDLEI
ncbi:MAG TPA: DUF2207 domain-containing protein, partial [Candidatus Acidoferrales bacterium]|nr:DUF2207 domain-containing protein [Candidatus Acidoferrales bacterium]